LQCFVKVVRPFLNETVLESSIDCLLAYFYDQRDPQLYDAMIFIENTTASTLLPRITPPEFVVEEGANGAATAPAGGPSTQSPALYALPDARGKSTTPLPK